MNSTAAKIVSDLACPHILALKAYTSARSEMPGASGYVWLDANENPYPPAVGGGWNRYPDPQPPELVARLTDLYGVKSDQILIGRGSDECIELLVRAFCRPEQDAILITPPTYGMYRVCADTQNAAVVEAPLNKNFDVDVDAVLAACKKDLPRVKLVFLCSPNNPTGNLLDRKKILTLVEKLRGQAIVVVDEAYVEFAETQSLAAELEKNPNLVVLRTLSKMFGLAGVRCGSLLAAPEIVSLLRKVQAPYPISKPVTEAVVANMTAGGLQLARHRITVLKQERARMAEALARHQDVKRVWPSDANYLFVETTGAAALMSKLKGDRIIIRNRNSDRAECVRFTIGTPEENELVLQSLGLSGGSSKPPRAPRRGECLRKTKETDIAAIVDLDATGPVILDTGVGFFDHMLEQIARHGGFAMTVTCKGDLHIDPHHTVEDCALALGAALKQALGDKKGLTRYGFVLAMDEATADVAIDLSGRPWCVFEGNFPDSHVGTFPSAMTPHFFKSLSDTLQAAIQVRVTGKDTHHMIESSFKSFARALGMALKVEGDRLPSTKGVL